MNISVSHFASPQWKAQITRWKSEGLITISREVGSVKPKTRRKYGHYFERLRDYMREHPRFTFEECAIEFEIGDTLEARTLLRSRLSVLCRQGELICSSTGKGPNSKIKPVYAVVKINSKRKTQ